MLDIGSIIDGKYKILNVIGKGGMSVVYQAVNERANKQWAIKEIRKDGVQNYEVVRQNLIAETDMLKKLNHPNLPSIIDVIDRQGTFLIVMDYIEGKPLSDILKASGAQPQEDVIEWAKQLCDVLGYLHSRRPAIIYRDMKPSNVMLKPDGNVTLIDFGTAREFKSTSVADTTCLGTRGYAAPEQFGGQGQTDARTDIYCLGATMYHLVTGHNPATPPYEMYPIRQWNPMLSSGLEEIILKCTQLNPNDRYQNCAELLYALDNIVYLEEENKKVQNLKWKVFLTSVMLTGVMAVGTLGFDLAANFQIDNTYQSFIERAKSEENIETRIDDCEQAIKVDSEKVDAFKILLQTYYNYDDDGYEQADQRLEYENEYNDFKTITSQYLDNGSDVYNTEEFADNIYLKLGEALFITCDKSTDGKNSSIPWLKKAANYCSDKNKDRANLLLTTAEYYKKMAAGALSATGELGNKDDYREYWENLKKIERMAMDDMESTNNIVLPLESCKLCVAEIQTRISGFKSGGIDKDNMLQFIDLIDRDVTKIKEKITSVASLDDSLSDMLKDQRALTVNISKAKDEIKRAFEENQN